MAIPTTRAKEKAEIVIDADKCIVCGDCVSVCKDFSIYIDSNELKISNSPAFGCIGCGHCMAICPTGAIKIYGRELSPENLIDLPLPGSAAGYDQLLSLLQRRRSVREFIDKEVDEEIVNRILDAAKTSPMGLPPSDVNVLVFNTKDKNHAFAIDLCKYLEDMRWFVSEWFMTLMRSFWGKANDEMFKGFVKPLFNIYINNIRRGINLVNYDAPLAMYFYGSPYCDPADPVVAATTAMYAGEAIGLGTCMLGGIHPLIQYGNSAKKFRKKYGIKYASREGLFVIFGYPSVQYKKGISRTFASVETVTV